MATQSFTVTPSGGQQITIFGEADNINFFLNTDLEPDDIGDVTRGTVGFDGYTRRRYPGDSQAISVDGGSRRFIKDPSRRSSAALPGWSFKLRDLSPGDNPEVRQFTCRGDYTDLHRFLSQKLSKPVRLYGKGKGSVGLVPASIIA